MIYFTGDINYCDGYFDVGIGLGTALRHGYDPLQFLPHNDEDIWVGNFEGVCSSVSVLQGVASQQFRIEPQHLQHFWHPNIYAVANNHVMQHGAEAYAEMLDNLEAMGCHTVGSEQHKSICFTHQGKTVALTALNQRPENFCNGISYWGCPEYKEIEAEFEKNVQGADFKVVYIHWGNEFMNRPYLDQRQFAHWLIDIGYDLVVGMHPHIMQGFECYKGKYVFYSLGNTVFNMGWYKTHYGALVKIDLRESSPIVDFDYVKIDKDFSPHIIAEDDVPSDCRFEYLNNLILTTNTENEKYYAELFKQMKRYRRANRLKIAANIVRLSPKTLCSIILDYIKRRF